MKIELQAHAFPGLTPVTLVAFRDLVLATKARRGEVVGLGRHFLLGHSRSVPLPFEGVYGRTPDGITRYPLAEVGPRWTAQAHRLALLIREDDTFHRLLRIVGQALSRAPSNADTQTPEVIHLRDAVVFTTLNTTADLPAPTAPALTAALRQTTVVVLPHDLSLTRQIHALGGAAHVLSERLRRIGRKAAPVELRIACSLARIVVLPPQIESTCASLMSK